ncbi:MAG: FHA domain-containing protein [Blastocatellia bacterium]|jgi:hypothetical protein
MNWLKKILADQSDAEPIVVANHLCRAIEDRLQVIQGGRKIFPFNRLIIRLRCATPEEESTFRAAFGDQQLQRHLRELLQRHEVATWRDLDVTLETTIAPADAPASERFEISYLQQEKPLPDATLIVTRGTAEPTRCPLRDLIRIGRTEEVLDLHGRLIRRNDLVFADQQDEINLSVGRIQARIEFDPARACFVLFDENSRHGTAVERGGRMMTATQQRGIALQHGDLLHLGRARCQFVVPPLD